MALIKPTKIWPREQIFMLHLGCWEKLVQPGIYISTGVINVHCTSNFGHITNRQPTSGSQSMKNVTGSKSPPRLGIIILSLHTPSKWSNVLVVRISDPNFDDSHHNSIISTR